MYSSLRCYTYYSILLCPSPSHHLSFWFGEFLFLEQFLSIWLSIKFVYSSHSLNAFMFLILDSLKQSSYLDYYKSTEVFLQGPQHLRHNPVLTLKPPSFPCLYLIAFFSIKISNYQNQLAIKMVFCLERLIHSIFHYLSQIFLELIFSLTDYYLHIPSVLFPSPGLLLAPHCIQTAIVIFSGHFQISFVFHRCSSYNVDILGKKMST